MQSDSTGEPFAGLWTTPFGPVRLTANASGVAGNYRYGEVDGQLEGTVSGDTLRFRYRESGTVGEGWFQLDAEAECFDGQWRAESATEWSAWTGQRLREEPGVTWLVVLEAHWQRGLAENDYAYGNMLGEVFARLPNVRVRQRFFHDAHSLERWCRDLVYLAEPAIVLIASHGVADGLSVRGEVINTSRLLEILRPAGNLRLVHFAACLVGQDSQKTFENQKFPISGYAGNVDWGSSLLLEMTYLDLILNRGLLPDAAAAALPKVIAWSGDEVEADSPYAAACFRFYPALPVTEA